MSNHNFQVLGFDTDITVVIPNDAEEFLPIVLKGGSLYDPDNGYKPINPKPKQKSLSQEQRERAEVIIEGAAKWWKPQASAAPSTETPAAPIQPTAPQSSLDKLVAKCVAELSVNSVMDFTKPFIEKYISETYGLLPKTIEVKTETETKKVMGSTHHEFETILKLVAADIPVFLTGPAGCGKNVICKQIAEALGKEFYFSNAVTQEYKITGFIDANGKYQETQFYKAFTQGGAFSCLTKWTHQPPRCLLSSMQLLPTVTLTSPLAELKHTPISASLQQETLTARVLTLNTRDASSLTHQVSTALQSSKFRMTRT